MPTPRNPNRDYHDASTEVTGASTDGSGDVTVDVGDLRRIPGPEYADAHITGGYVAEVQSVSGNSVTVRVYQEADTGGTLAAVTNSNTGEDVRVNAKGH